MLQCKPARTTAAQQRPHPLVGGWTIARTCQQHAGMLMFTCMINEKGKPASSKRAPMSQASRQLHNLLIDSLPPKKGETAPKNGVKAPKMGLKAPKTGEGTKHGKARVKPPKTGVKVLDKQAKHSKKGSVAELPKASVHSEPGTKTDENVDEDLGVMGSTGHSSVAGAGLGA